MGYYAKINNGVVETVIVADADVVATMDGTWVETFIDASYAGIGHGFDSVNFVAPPYDGAVWNGSAWEASVAMQLEAALALIDMLMEV